MHPASAYLTLLPVWWIQPIKLPSYLDTPANPQATDPQVQPSLRRCPPLTRSAGGGSHHWLLVKAGLEVSKNTQRCPGKNIKQPLSVETFSDQPLPLLENTICTKHPHMRK